MTQGPLAVPPETLTSGQRIALIIFGAPAFAACSLWAIVFVSGQVGFDLFGQANLSYIVWALGELLALVLAILIVVVCEAFGIGGVWVYTLAGGLAGTASLYFFQASTRFDETFWVPPLQFAVVGLLLGLIAYRRPTRRDCSPEGPEERT
jgi:hypothetical protein